MKRVPWRRLTPDDVRTIRTRRRRGESLASLGREFGVHHTTIRAAALSLTFKRLDRA